MIDRQPFDWSLTTWLGVSDLAYMMVHWWETALRRQYELPILRRYHAALVERGITTYSWPQLLRDYRLCAVQSIYVATAWCAAEESLRTMRWVWWPLLLRSLAACADLRCAELWAGAR